MEKNRFLQLIEAKMGNVKPLLNEYYAQKFDNNVNVDPYGNQVVIDKKNGTLKLNIKVDFENQYDGYPELRLQPGVVFKKVGSNLVSSNQTYQLVNDLQGTDRGSGKGTITYYCKSNNLDISGRVDQYKKYNLFWNENWPSVEKGFKDLCAAKILPTTPKVPALPANQCNEYKARLQNPVQANAGDIQKFLNALGYKLTVDFAFGDGTATAVGTFLYGAKAGLNTVTLLHKKLVDTGKLPQGDKPGFGPKMAQAIANEINAIVKTKSNCNPAAATT